jgi:hypothetical protein
MRDKELLELAAKAAWGNLESGWNPLTDDADALRLAVKLELNVLVGVAKDGEGRIVVETSLDDPYAATRRAITRAAAEIGKAMP